MSTAIHWFRRDLRLDDLPALAAAAAAADRVLALFVLDPALIAPAGPNRRRFLAASLRALDAELGGGLLLRRGDPREVLPAVAAQTGARLVTATADFGPYGAARDRALAAALAPLGVTLRCIDSPYAVAPGTLRSAAGSPFRVFSAFRRGWASEPVAAPAPAPALRLASGDGDATLAELDAAPSPPTVPAWWEGLPLGPAPALPVAGAGEASARLERFLAGPLARYDAERDLPAVAGTSALSPFLHFGAIHPRAILARLPGGDGAERLRSELAWRDFYADVLWHRPDSAQRPLQGFGEHLRWDTGERARERFRAWATGRTGYPLVDAGMRQLLAEGWMHNRVRMVTASFLVKDLHIDWRLGARWFMWHLVDGDLASNQHGWQWVAGTGTDAAPFHRVLNPTTQAERFDRDGEYLARYIPELTARDGRYPEPIVDHTTERRVALERFAHARRASAGAAPPR